MRTRSRTSDGPRLNGEQLLRAHAGRERGRRVPKRHEERVALGLHFGAAVFLPSLAEQLVVSLEERRISIPKEPEDACRTFDVGEDEGHDPGRQTGGARHAHIIACDQRRGTGAVDDLVVPRLYRATRRVRSLSPAARGA